MRSAVFGIYSSIIDASSQSTHWAGRSRSPGRLRARDEEALDSLDWTAGVRHPRPGTPSHYLDGTIQYVRPCSATGTFMEPSDKRTWIGAVLMGGRTSELIINCDWQRRQFPKIPLRKGIIRCGGVFDGVICSRPGIDSTSNYAPFTNVHD